MDEIEKQKLREFYSQKSEEDLRRSLGLLLEYEMYEKAAIVREVAGKNLDPISWEETMIKHIEKFINDKRETDTTEGNA